jgi:hypothetical protein
MWGLGPGSILLLSVLFLNPIQITQLPAYSHQGAGWKRKIADVPQIALIHHLTLEAGCGDGWKKLVILRIHAPVDISGSA